ncbi:hypothetical protein PG996_012491 [Apiospora saccharicola]|uniref:FAD/NAD(P)-binding domain-containing protein n=1 Tax=Apiospora saccharicola TaxID=335842 RepID=A0ABR1U2R2_9PEZI
MAATPDDNSSKGEDPTPALSFLTQKYEEEKAKRLRADGSAQYNEFESCPNARLRGLVDDPWVDHAHLNAQQPPNLADGQHIKVLSLGAGIAGLVYTTHLLETGAFVPEDIRLVDTAGGFGGAWYWNRFPGLACDVEASIYLPWLERTEYVPRHRYAHGEDIRRYLESVAEKFGLDTKGVFRTRVDKMTWDEGRRCWVVDLEQRRGPRDEENDLISFSVTAQYVVLANGILNHPKAPKIEGLEGFAGDMMHASRWDYSVSGGSPTDPRLTKLKGKRVGVVGTGASGVQCVAALAEWAGELYVFQRTPSTVDAREQREMSAEEWAKVSEQPGWWSRRNINFVDAVAGEIRPEDNLVDDGWTKAPTLSMVAGARHEPLLPEDIPGHIERMLAKDVPRSNRMRQRVVDLVTKDQETAEALKPWYPTWCKRPCFHDTYLQTFNQSHVTLVPTEAHGLHRATSRGLVVKDREYPLDVLVFATGYRSPVHHIAEPSAMSNTPIVGRGGRTMASKWSEDGPGSLHGLFTRGFPNLLLTGPSQQGISGNVTYMYDVAGRHAAYVLAEAEKKANASKGSGFAVIEPAEEAEEAYVHHLLSLAAFHAPMGVCLPNYRNDESAVPVGDDALKAAKATTYPLGINAWSEFLEEWRGTGRLEGLEITTGETVPS